MSLIRPVTIAGIALPHNLVLAPLAGITNHVFRCLCREAGAALAFTEMVSVNGMIREGEKSWKLLDSSVADQPLGVQLFGEDPLILAEAARMVGDSVQLIDINMGCPVRKVVGGGAGSALLQDPPKVAAIIRAVRKATHLPLTIKIRSGWLTETPTFLEIGTIAQDEGCDAITLHPRSRAQMFDGKANWEHLKGLVQHCRIPVIGSGDLFTPEDCRAMLQETGCAAVMIARGALGNPWIFKQTLELLQTGSYQPVTVQERVAMALDHLERFRSEAGEAIAVREMKKHVAWYIHGVPGGAALRREANQAGDTHVLAACIERMGS